MLGHAKELEKNMVYAHPDWDSPLMRIKQIKKGKQGVVITHQDGERKQLDNYAAVRFFEAGREPKQ